MNQNKVSINKIHTKIEEILNYKINKIQKFIIDFNLSFNILL
jgi:hypothetical protein